MIYRKKSYKINPNNLEKFNDFFHKYLFPNQIMSGAKLIGRWVNESNDKIEAIWQYESLEQYEHIEKMIRSSELHQKAKEKRAQIGELFIESHQEFLHSTSLVGTYEAPKHIVSVSGFITNDLGEVLLVRNEHRSDTMEMPGGQVEEGENLAQAIHREINEETGVNIKLTGVTGIYQNIKNNIICVVFRGQYESGELKIEKGETTEVIFTNLEKIKLEKIVTRPHFRTRILDALNANYIPYESYDVNPFELINRYEVKQEI
ncbi:NUDIX domain-containing protein [Bacillus sp. AFS041924]|uniref:NUDIX domain-containing protein n=1 Tax=Bacillus sp. AFS041924 TaxID=2033503 RepID=UPI00159B8673|nr:NUDIX domain-containing protein [Bacillus sp. AFS041924]